MEAKEWNCLRRSYPHVFRTAHFSSIDYRDHIAEQLGRVQAAVVVINRGLKECPDPWWTLTINGVVQMHERSVGGITWWIADPDRDTAYRLAVPWLAAQLEAQHDT